MVIVNEASVKYISQLLLVNVTITIFAVVFIGHFQEIYFPEEIPDIKLKFGILVGLYLGLFSILHFIGDLFSKLTVSKISEFFIKLNIFVSSLMILFLGSADFLDTFPQPIPLFFGLLIKLLVYSFGIIIPTILFLLFTYASFRIMLIPKTSLLDDVNFNEITKNWSQEKKVKLLFNELYSVFPRTSFSEEYFSKVGIFSEVLKSFKCHGFVVESPSNSNGKKKNFFYIGPSGIQLVNSWKLEKLTVWLVILTICMLFLIIYSII